jgi:hypothetical protein
MEETHGTKLCQVKLDSVISWRTRMSREKGEGKRERGELEND